MEENEVPKKVYSNASILCPGHTRTVVGLDCSENTPDGVFFVSACLDEKPMLRDAKSGNWIGSFLGHDGAVWSSSINQNATLVATASADFTGKLWDATTGKMLHSFTEKHIVKSVSLSSDSSLVAFGGKSKEVNIYSTKTYELVVSYNFKEEVSFIRFCPFPDKVQHLLCVGLSGKMTLLDISNPSTIEVRSIQLTDIILDLSLSKDVIVIATCNGVRFLSWSLDIVAKKDYPYHIKTCCLNQSHTRYLISDVNVIHEVDYSSHQILASYHGHHGTIFCLRYCPDDHSFISGSDDSSIRLWNVESNLYVCFFKHSISIFVFVFLFFFDQPILSFIYLHFLKVTSPSLAQLVER